MAKQTEHYGLNKPESSEFYDVGIGNDNLDVIDELIKGNEDKIKDIAGEGRTTETVVGAYAVAGAAETKVDSLAGEGWINETVKGNAIAIANKVDKITGKGLSTNDFTTTEKNKLANIEGNATATIIVNNLTETVAGKALDATRGKTLNDALTSHINNTSNPHTVTKTQVGLGNVDNIKQMPNAGGTFTGIAVAQTNTSYTTSQLRNIYAGTTDMTAGTTALANGAIYLVYE